MDCQESIFNNLLNNPGLWPTILKLIMEKMPNSDAKKFAMVNKASREAIKKYRPEIQRIKFYFGMGDSSFHTLLVRRLRLQLDRSLPEIFDCLPAFLEEPLCMKIARLCFNYGNQMDAKEILKAHTDFLKNGTMQARCYFAWYCLNIDDEDVYSFLAKDTMQGKFNLTKNGFLGTRGLEVRRFFIQFPFLIHQWILKGQRRKSFNALKFFTGTEERHFRERIYYNCWKCERKHFEEEHSTDYDRFRKNHGNNRFDCYFDCTVWPHHNI